MSPKRFTLGLLFAIAAVGARTAPLSAQPTGDPNHEPCETTEDWPPMPGEPDHCLYPPDAPVGEVFRASFVVETLEEADAIVVRARWENQVAYSHLVVNVSVPNWRWQGLPTALKPLADDGWLYATTLAARLQPGDGIAAIRLDRDQLRAFFGDRVRITADRARIIGGAAWPADGPPRERRILRYAGAPGYSGLTARQIDTTATREDRQYMPPGEVWIVAGPERRARMICPAATRTLVPDLQPHERQLATLLPTRQAMTRWQNTIVPVHRHRPVGYRQRVDRQGFWAELSNIGDQPFMRVRWEGVPEDRLVLFDYGARWEDRHGQGIEDWTHNRGYPAWGELGFAKFVSRVTAGNGQLILPLDPVFQPYRRFTPKSGCTIQVLDAFDVVVYENDSWQKVLSTTRVTPEQLVPGSVSYVFFDPNWIPHFGYPDLPIVVIRRRDLAADGIQNSAVPYLLDADDRTPPLLKAQLVQTPPSR